ncbi:23S rRNA pseudouridine synthase D [Chitinispirillum alkaliphilum]|nr:23S rRNA pseudouridine synthase D [Chitinispirillum alkaliphilum]
MDQTDKRGVPHRFTVDPESEGKRLDLFLAGKIQKFTRSALQKVISEGHVLINNTAASKNTRLSQGDTVEVISTQLAESADYRKKPQPQKLDLDILYEDSFFLAVNKPAGLVVHPGNGNPDRTLVNGLVYHLGEISRGSAVERPGIVHRLDKDTSGVLIVAKSDEAHQRVSKLFCNREIKKRYAAFCIGAVPDTEGQIDSPLARSRKNPLKRSVDFKGGKPALTSYRLIKHKRGISFLTLSPFTGRTHQIRVHSSHCGFPVLNDDLYGGGRERVLKFAPMDRPFAYSVLKCFSRHALHAFSLKFVHPFTFRPIEIKAPLPADFQQAMSVMQVEWGL